MFIIIIIIIYYFFPLFLLLNLDGKCYNPSSSGVQTNDNNKNAWQTEGVEERYNWVSASMQGHANIAKEFGL